MNQIKCYQSIIDCQNEGSLSDLICSMQFGKLSNRVKLFRTNTSCLLITVQYTVQWQNKILFKIGRNSKIIRLLTPIGKTRQLKYVTK